LGKSPARKAGREGGLGKPAWVWRRFSMAHYDNDESRPLAQASARGKVKWFNATKGYGFVTLDNGGDAFCHASALQSAGHAELPAGASIVCDLTDSQRGLQVVTVHTVDLSTAETPGARGPRRDFGNGGDRFGGGRWSKARSSSSTTRKASAL